MVTMDLEEVCALLKISPDTGRNRLYLGLPMPPSFRVGRRRLFLTSEVEGWLHGQAGIVSPVPNSENDSVAILQTSLWRLMNHTRSRPVKVIALQAGRVSVFSSVVHVRGSDSPRRNLMVGHRLSAQVWDSDLLFFCRDRHNMWHTTGS